MFSKVHFCFRKFYYVSFSHWVFYFLSRISLKVRFRETHMQLCCFSVISPFPREQLVDL